MLAGLDMLVVLSLVLDCGLHESGRWLGTASRVVDLVQFEAGRHGLGSTTAFIMVVRSVAVRMKQVVLLKLRLVHGWVLVC